jgi:hypothetical protein
LGEQHALLPHSVILQLTELQMFFTVMTVMAHIVSQSGDNANMSNEYRKNISPEEAATRIKGAKSFIVGWFTYTGMLWTLKMCVLSFLRRVTSGLQSAKLIMPVLYLVLISWVINLVLFFASCRPFYQYWQIYPDPGSKFIVGVTKPFGCTNKEQNTVLHRTLTFISSCWP